MKQFSLIPKWLRQYDKADLRFDIVAGLTVGVMLIPQGMAYAMVAGLPPIYGLYASTFPAIIYAWFGTSKQLSVGPGALTALLTAAAISLVAQTGSENYIVLVALLAFTVGAIQLTVGWAKLGFLVNFLSNPVILGFTSSAAIIIGLTQLKHFFGIQLFKTQHLHEIVVEISQQLPNIHWLTFAIGAGGLIALLLLQKFLPQIPSALIVVTISILITWIFRLDLLGIKIVGIIPDGLPTPRLNSIDFTTLLTLLPSAFAIALVSFVESTAVARSIQSRHKNYTLIPNRELVAIGLANMTNGVIPAMPVTGGMARSMINDHAGARTGLASIISSVLVLLTLIFLTSLFYFLPNAILAGVIITAVLRLLKIKEAKKLWLVDRKDFWMMMATFVGTLFLGIGPGISIGVLLSMSWIVFEASYPHHAELGKVEGTHSFRNVRRFKNLLNAEGVLIFRFDAPLFFANIIRFKEVLLFYKNQRKDSIHSIILDMESINTIDSSAIDIFSDLIDDFSKENIRLLLSEVKGPVRDKLYKSGLTEKIGAHYFFVTTEDAYDFVTGRKGDYASAIALQTNAINDTK